MWDGVVGEHVVLVWYWMQRLGCRRDGWGCVCGGVDFGAWIEYVYVVGESGFGFFCFDFAVVAFGLS